MSTLAIEIRPAEPDDAPGIADVHREAWGNAYSGIIPFRALHAMINRRQLGWWDRAIRASTGILVVDVGGTIAGYATFGPNRARALKPEGEIYELYLRPEYQGVGLGRRLFGEARGLLASLGCKGLVVWALEENETALQFYAAMGGIDIAEGSETFGGKRLRKLAFVWN